MENKEKGKFIVIEGTDGSGKRTQVDLLAEYLQAKGKGVYKVDFPQYEDSFFGKVVGRFLTGEFGGIKEVHPVLASLPYAGDRFQKKDDIYRAIGDGLIVLANRYTPSNKAHQTAKLPEDQRKGFVQFLDEMEYEVFGIPREDSVVLLNVVASVSRTLVDAKGARTYLGGTRKRDIQEEDLTHQQKAAEVYRWLATLYPHWTIVECCNANGSIQSREEIHEKIVSVVRTKIIPEC